MPKSYHYRSLPENRHSTNLVFSRVPYLDDDILMRHEQRYGRGLNWGHSLEAHSIDGVDDPFC